MEIGDEIYINSMNDISKHFQIMLDNKDKRIADLQSQLDQAKSEITKYKILLNDMETENSHLETMLNQANEKIMWLNAEIDTLKSEKENLMRTLEEAEKKLQELRGGDFSGE